MLRLRAHGGGESFAFLRCVPPGTVRVRPSPAPRRGNGKGWTRCPAHPCERRRIYPGRRMSPALVLYVALHGAGSGGTSPPASPSDWWPLTAGRSCRNRSLLASRSLYLGRICVPAPVRFPLGGQPPLGPVGLAPTKRARCRCSRSRAPRGPATVAYSLVKERWSTIRDYIRRHG